jgi:hypothetical protein
MRYLGVGCKGQPGPPVRIAPAAMDPPAGEERLAVSLQRVLSPASGLAS